MDAQKDLDSQSAKENKILELSKKNRALNLQLEKEKTQANQLRRELEALQKNAGSPRPTGPIKPGRASAGTCRGPRGFREE